MVLKENMKVQADREKKGKFEPTWLGPYIVRASFGSGAYQLSTPEGELLSDPTNIIHLKKFYAWFPRYILLEKYKKIKKSKKAQKEKEQ